MVSDEDANPPALTFQELCELKKADRAELMALSPGKTRAACQLQFTLESFPAGEKPEAPVNIISPEPTEATSKRSPDGRPDKKYLQTHQKQCEDALAEKPGLVFIGDSITARWPPQLLKGKLARYKPFNMGCGGDWMQNTLWRVKNGVLGEVKPKAVVLLIGTNNVTHMFSVEEVTAGTKAIIDEIHKQSPNTHVIVMGIFPRGKSIHNNRLYEIIKLINANLAKIADEKETITFLDIGDKLVEPDGSITDQMMKDRLHIGMPGFIIWEAAIIPVIDVIFKQ
jgi:lysophospholipase L1-like esterase